MTERDKIANVLNSTEISQELSKEDIYKFADALIAAGLFADVRSLAEGSCVLYVKGRGFMRLYNEQDINEMIHRAEVAERQAIFLSKMLAEKTRRDYPWQAWFDAAQKQAEKELAEEKNND